MTFTRAPIARHPANPHADASLLGEIEPALKLLGGGAALVAIIGGMAALLSVRGPKLEMRFSGPPDDAKTVLVDYTDPSGEVASVSSHWLRLCVTNRDGRWRRSANDVEVGLHRVSRIAHQGSSQVPLDSVGLIWSNQTSPKSKIDIAPGSSRRVDVGTLCWPEPIQAIPKDGSPGCWVELQVLPKPSARRDHLAAGTYELELSLDAKDVRAKHYRVWLKATGAWYSDSAVWDGFKLYDLQRTRWWNRQAKGHPLRRLQSILISLKG